MTQAMEEKENIRVTKVGSGQRGTIPESVPFAELPSAVARYLDIAVSKGTPAIHHGRLFQKGMFRAGIWSPFTAEHYFCTDPPGFVWNATLRVARLIPISVRDSYLTGIGSMRGKIFGRIPMMNQTDEAEINASALQRYLAESVWYPTVLLPGGIVHWQELDARRALATLSDNGLEVTMEFHFNHVGEVEKVYTDGRYRYEKGSYIRTPWSAHLSNYKSILGFRIPTECEVEWKLPRGSFSYFRGSIFRIEYDDNVADVDDGPACCCSCSQ